MFETRSGWLLKQILKKIHLVGTYYTNISWCTVHSMSDLLSRVRQLEIMLHTGEQTMSSTCICFVTQICRQIFNYFSGNFLTKCINAPIVFSKATTCSCYRSLLQFTSTPKHHMEEKVLQNATRWPNSYLPLESVCCLVPTALTAGNPHFLWDKC